MLTMAYPPSKRLKEDQYDDPFMDDGEFTQDDLNEIDVIASQAISESAHGTGTNLPLKLEQRPVGQGKPEGRKTFALSSHPGLKRGVDIGGPGVSHGYVKSSNGHSSTHRKEEDHYRKLEEQHSSLLEKLKQVQEEILMKNGEISVLRDSLRQANQDKDQQRLAQYQLERERAQTQSDKEKEFAKKIQALQSELHFKDAEISQIKSKLTEKGGKHPVTPSSKNRTSPKIKTPTIVQPDKDTRVSPGGTSFITKETFTAQLAIKRTPPRKSSARGESDTNQCRESLESERIPNVFPYHQVQQGSGLLNLLIQHPLDPSSVSLCHLLCITPESLSGLLSQQSFISLESLCSSSTFSSSSLDVPAAHQPRSHFSQLQSLAMSGLSALSFTCPTHKELRTEGDCFTLPRSCPNAVYLLPLLEHHLSLFCQALESAESLGKSPLHGMSLSSTSTGSTLRSNPEQSPVSQEDLALAALKAVQLTVSYSHEAMQILLSETPKVGAVEAHSDDEEPGSPQPGTSKDIGRADRKKRAERTPQQHSTGNGQHPLLKRLIQLADPTYSSGTNHRDALVTGSLKTLCSLAEQADVGKIDRLECLVENQVFVQCLSVDSTSNTVLSAVRLLTVLVSSDDVTENLCSHRYACPLLKLCQHITSRTDKRLLDDNMVKLKIETIRFLSRFFSQKAFKWTTFLEASCQCHCEVVRAVVMTLHGQWLSLHDARWRLGEPVKWEGLGVILLREAIIVLYWLLQNDSNFSDHCVDVLHMYERMVPAIRDTFRLIPNLKESEELALDEICRSVAETVEDMDVDTGF